MFLELNNGVESYSLIINYLQNPNFAKRVQELFNLRPKRILKQLRANKTDEIVELQSEENGSSGRFPLQQELKNHKKDLLRDNMLKVLLENKNNLPVIDQINEIEEDKEEKEEEQN